MHLSSVSLTCYYFIGSKYCKLDFKHFMIQIRKRNFLSKSQKLFTLQDSFNSNASLVGKHHCSNTDLPS